LSAPAGSGGLVFVPYLEGERTPNRPEATGAIHGARLDNTTPQHLARAAVEGMLCGLADGLAALVELGIDVGRALLIGGGARSPAVQRIAPDILGVPVQVPPAGEYVADGAARQAGWVLAGTPGPPSWSSRAMSQAMLEPGRDGAGARIRDQYRAARDLVLKRSA
jgi:xylulokinase